jgi:hypothetical protein
MSVLLLLAFAFLPVAAHAKSTPPSETSVSVELASAADESEVNEIQRLMTRANIESRKDRWFWACEAWLELLKKKPGLQTPRARLAQAFRLAESRSSAENADSSEKLYFDTLQAYLVQDNASLWARWQELEKFPRYAEEARWFLWGPQARFYREASGDPGWEKSAALFRQGWKKALESDWRAAAPLFRESAAARSDHFLAAIYLETARAEATKSPVPAAVPARPAPRWFPGTPAERLEAGRGAFRQGRWSLALALFASAAVPASPSEIRVRARHAVDRLEWMFNTQRAASGE